MTADQFTAEKAKMNDDIEGGQKLTRLNTDHPTIGLQPHTSRTLL
jgi:hypothetical protein